MADSPPAPDTEIAPEPTPRGLPTRALVAHRMREGDCGKRLSVCPARSLSPHSRGALSPGSLRIRQTAAMLIFPCAGNSEWASRTDMKGLVLSAASRYWTEGERLPHPAPGSSTSALNSAVTPYQCPSALLRAPEPASVSRKAIPGYLCCFLMVKII